jgi:hypothetical protein
MRRDAFGIDHRLIRRHVQMQVLLVDPPEGAQVGPQRCARPFTGVVVHFTSAITIIIPCPLMDAMADRRMGWMTSPVTLPLISIEPRAPRRNVLGDQRCAGTRVGMVAYPPALLPRLTRDDTDDGGPIIGIGAVPLPLVGTPPRRISGVEMGRACFPPRSDTPRLPQRRCRASPQSARSRSGWPESAVVAYGVVCARPPTRERGGPSAHPWQSRAVTVPRSPGAAGFSRRSSPSTACSNHGRPDSDRPESGHGRGISACLDVHNVGMSAPAGEGDVPTKGYTYYHPLTRRSGTLSCGYHTIVSTVATHEPRYFRTVSAKPDPVIAWISDNDFRIPSSSSSDGRAMFKSRKSVNRKTVSL